MSLKQPTNPFSPFYSPTRTPRYTPSIVPISICCYLTTGVTTSTSRDPLLQWTTRILPRNGKRRRGNHSTTRKIMRQRPSMRLRPQCLRQPTHERRSSTRCHKLHLGSIQTGSQAARTLQSIGFPSLKSSSTQLSNACHQNPTSQSAAAPSRPQSPRPPLKAKRSP
jgi:hypothetical protein